MPESKTNSAPARSGVFASLRFRNFRIWFIGQLTSLFGTWMQATALGYYAYEITGSKTFLGTVTFAAGLPTIFLMLFGGLAADHFPRRRLIIATQTVMMALAFLLSGFAFLRLTTGWLLIAFAFLNGIANAFDAPARQAFILEMVDRKRLGNAIALNSTMFNIATFAGPLLGGSLYALVGPGWCFAVNGASFLAVILGLLLMHLPPAAPPPAVTRPFAGILQGVRYIAREKIIGRLILVALLVSVFGFSLFALFPAWAVEALHGDAVTNGLLQSARGLGSLVSALIIASLAHVAWKGKLLQVGMFLVPACFGVFALAASLPFSLVIALHAGMAMMIVFNLANSLIQHHVKDDFRGRVMSIYSLTFFGAAPIGSLAAGALADAIGTEKVILGASAVLFAFALAMLFLDKKIKSA